MYTVFILVLFLLIVKKTSEFLMRKNLQKI